LLFKGCVELPNINIDKLFLSLKIMKKLFKNLSFLCVIFLAACGGGGSSDSSSFTVTRASEGTTYSCPTQATYDVCLNGSCAQCTCTIGCDANAPKVKLAVAMTPASLVVDEAGDLRMTLSSAAAVSQTASFTLKYPAGGVGYSAFSFSAPCTTYSLSVGGESFIATVVVPANTASCTFDVRKRFFAAANPVVFELTGLDKVELEGTLPSVIVVP
jgi:hypothetical protein